MGYLMNWGLFGIVTIQVYYYYIAFPRDRRAFKCLVYGYGNFEAIDRLPLTGLLIPILGGTVGWIVQLFYAYHIKTLSKTNVIPILIMILSMLCWIAGMATGILAFRLGALTQLHHRSASISAGTWWATSVLIDVMIGVTMTYLFFEPGSSLRETHTLVTRIVRIIVETGNITAVVSIVTLFCFFGWMYKSYFTCPALILAKLYSNTLLMTFNSRMHIMGSRDESFASLDLSTGTGGSGSGNATGPAKARTNVEPSPVPIALGARPPSECLRDQKSPSESPVEKSAEDTTRDNLAAMHKRAESQSSNHERRLENRDEDGKEPVASGSQDTDRRISMDQDQARN